jgi:hypothetical protein
VYRLDINDYFDHQPIQLIVETWWNNATLSR